MSGVLVKSPCLSLIRIKNYKSSNTEVDIYGKCCVCLFYSPDIVVTISVGTAQKHYL